MSDMASKYRAAAHNARDRGDEINAAWLDEHADWHDTDNPNTRRVKAAIERLETGHDCV